MSLPRVPLPFRRHPALVGMVHLPSLPGSPGWNGSMAHVLAAVEADVDALTRAGVDGILLENYGDVPFRRDRVEPETVAALTRAVIRAQERTDLAVGVNVLRNDAAAALGIAAATGAVFIRVNVHTGVMYADQGRLDGRADDTIRRRTALGVDCAILADVHVKHATPVVGETVEAAAADTWERGRADALVVSGAGTGRPTDPGRVARVREAVPDAPVWVGSGVTPETLPGLAPQAAGFIVGSWMQTHGRAGGRVDPERARRMAAAVGRLREVD